MRRHSGGHSRVAAALAQSSMSVIDKTPLLKGKGSSAARKDPQDAPESSPASLAELETRLAGVLDERYTLIRNLPLGNKKIVEPLVLVGPPGVFVLYISPVARRLDVRDEPPNAIQGPPSVRPSASPVARVARLANALQLYLTNQGVILPGTVEPVLIAGSPAVHIEVGRHRVRVVLGDGAEDFAASLLQQPTRLTSDAVEMIIDHLINPRSHVPADQTQPVRVRAATAPAKPQTSATEAPDASARARAIFRAAEEAQPLVLADLNLELDGSDVSSLPYELAGEIASQRPTSPRRRKGFSGRQWTLLVLLVLAELLVLSAFVLIVLFGA